MVIAQFTGIGLQKDDNAFVRYNITHLLVYMMIIRNLVMKPSVLILEQDINPNTETST